MAKYKSYDYSQRVMIPISLDDQLVPGTLEFAIHTLVETRMDTSIFDIHYRNDEVGRSAYDPKVLLKIILFGYSRGLTTSRKLERACRENVIFMALTCGQQPDHSTIAAFVSNMKDEILPLFRDVLMVCEESSLLAGTFFALDGCKIPSNVSIDMSGKFSDLERMKDNIERKVGRLLEEQVDADLKDDEDNGTPTGGSNREKQIERLQKKAERIKDWLNENKPKIGKQGREIKSNVSDNDSALMISSHGNFQGYNGQAFVDSKHQVIIHGEVFGVSQDHHLIPPMIDGAKENVKAIGLEDDYFAEKIFTADASYSSPVNLKKCHEERLDAYIPDRVFRMRDPRFKGRGKKPKRFPLDDFKYHEENDTYICPNGKVLKLTFKTVEVNGIIYRGYRADEKDCTGCKLREKCLRKGSARQRQLRVPVGSVIGNLTKMMKAKVDSEEGRKIYHNV
jgi:transposase